MKKKKQYFWLSEETSINLTPLLDVIFNLIFFFLLATTIKQTQALIEINLPGAREASVVEEKEMPLVVSVNAEDEIYFNEELVTLEVLETRLEEVSERKEKIVIVRGDSQTHHQTIVDVLDVCSRTGFTQVKLEVEKETDATGKVK